MWATEPAASASSRAVCCFSYSAKIKSSTWCSTFRDETKIGTAFVLPVASGVVHRVGGATQSGPTFAFLTMRQSLTTNVSPESKVNSTAATAQVFAGYVLSGGERERSLNRTTVNLLCW